MAVWTAARRAKQSLALKRRWAKVRAAKNGQEHDAPMRVTDIPGTPTMLVILENIEINARELRLALTRLTGK